MRCWLCGILQLKYVNKTCAIDIRYWTLRMHDILFISILICSIYCAWCTSRIIDFCIQKQTWHLQRAIFSSVILYLLVSFSTLRNLTKHNIKKSYKIQNYCISLCIIEFDCFHHLMFLEGKESVHIHVLQQMHVYPAHVCYLSIFQISWQTIRIVYCHYF